MSGFKVGDILSPIKGKKTSNDYRIEKLLEVEVLYISKPSYGKTYILVKIIKGNCTDNYRSNYKKGNNISVYTDAFELISEREPEYEPY